MTKQKIFFFFSALAILVIGFLSAVYFDQDLASARRLKNDQEIPQFPKGLALVPDYAPSPAAQSAPAANPYAVAPTAPAEVINDPKTNQVTKIINIVLSDNITPNKVYLTKGESVQLNFINQQAKEARVFSPDKTRIENIAIASGATKAVSYDTSRFGDVILACETCTPPSPLFVRILGGVRAPSSVPAKNN